MLRPLLESWVWFWAPQHHRGLGHGKGHRGVWGDLGASEMRRGMGTWWWLAWRREGLGGFVSVCGYLTEVMKKSGSHILSGVK